MQFKAHISYCNVLLYGYGISLESVIHFLFHACVFDIRCNTDISMATNCGMKSLLVLSGVSTLSDVEEYKASGDLVQSTYVPTYYTSKLGQLGKLLGFSIS